MSLGKVYLASGWFSPEWLEEVENIKQVFDAHQVRSLGLHVPYTQQVDYQLQVVSAYLDVVQ